MGGVVVLHPQDVLNYNRMPLISPSPLRNHELKSRVHNPNFIPNFNSNRRKRSPQKKPSDLTKSPPKSSNFDHHFNGSQKKFNDSNKSPPKSFNFDQKVNFLQNKSNEFFRSPPKSSNVDHKLTGSQKKTSDFSRLPPKSSNFDNKVNGSQKKTSDFCRSPPKSYKFDQKVNCVRGLQRFSPKGGAHLTDGKISSANKLVMEKVKILKRGEALTNDDEVDKENKYERVVNLESKEAENTKKKKKMFVEGNKYEDVVKLKNNDNKKTEKKKMVLFDKESKYEKVVNLEKNGDKKTEKKMLFDKDNKSKKKVGLEEVVDLNPKHDLESVELLMRLGPEPGMLPKQIHSGMLPKQIHLADFYAGSAFVDSPDPSSLPFPPFLNKGTSEIELTPKIDDSNDDDNGSSHLRRLLKLAF
ncbi:hypothetical protein LIER_18076 [Lithospermum erythrorhizon]|uniref:Uncharacterized protein n=1 Tax=Lithospermum erythrorhizon TaxID=34254 RepID=A0AAV3QFF8_LITER